MQSIIPSFLLCLLLGLLYRLPGQKLQPPVKLLLEPAGMPAAGEDGYVGKTAQAVDTESVEAGGTVAVDANRVAVFVPTAIAVDLSQTEK